MATTTVAARGTTRVPPPWPHQVYAVVAALTTLQSTGGFYLQHYVGTGKTRTSLTTARALGAKRVLVLAPPVALGVWTREIDRWWPGHPPVVLVRHTVPPLPAVAIALTNYEQLVGTEGERRVKALIRWKPDLLICDEAHMIKSPTSQRTRATRRIAAVSRYKLLMSGTPAHSPLDWWSQYRIIAPKDHPLWGKPFTYYKERVALLGGPEGRWVIGFKPDGVLEAEKAMEPYTHRAGPLALPTPIETVIPVELSPAERRTYEEIRRHLVARFPDGSVAEASTALVEYLRLAQVSCGHIVDTDGNLKVLGDSKLRACMDLIDERSDQKIVVAFRFLANVPQVAKELERRGRPYYIITGDTPVRERWDKEASFQTKKDNAVMLVQIRAGGVSISFTAASSLIIFSLDPSAITFQQLIGRVWRPGQVRHVQILPLIGDKTIDAVMYEAVKRNLSVVQLVKLLNKAIRG